jgi:hypothetical protein
MKYAVLGIVAIVILVGALLITGDQNRIEVNNLQPGIGGGPPNMDTNFDLNLQERSQLHPLLQEHAAIAAMHLPRLYNGEDITETTEKMQENTEKLSEFYNDNPRFVNSWREHIEMYEAYTLALKENNSEEVQIIKGQFTDHSREFGQIINSITPSVTEDEAADTMNEHAILTLSIIDAHAQNDDSEKAAQIAKASAQAIEFAETLVP